jgi:hypothetical protein
VSSSKLILAVMCLRRVRVVCRSFAAAQMHVSTVVTPSAHAAQNLASFFRISVTSCFLKIFEKRNEGGLAGTTHQPPERTNFFLA